MTEEVRVATIVEARGAVNAVSVIDRGIAVVESRSVIDVVTLGGGGGGGLSATLNGYVKGDGAGHFSAATSVPWTDVSGTPTTLGGYGITDAYTKTQSDALYLPIGGTAADASTLQSATWASPAAIGSTTPASGAFSPLVVGSVGAQVTLQADAAHTIAQRNGLNAQVWRLYNYFIDGANYERFFVGWAGNLLSIGTEKGGSGTVRNLVLQSSGGGVGIGVTPTVALDVSGATARFWNQGGTNQTLVQIRNGSSQGGNNVLQVVDSVGTTTIFSVLGTGLMTVKGDIHLTDGTNDRFTAFSNLSNGGASASQDAGGFRFGKGGSFSGIGAGGGGYLSNERVITFFTNNDFNTVKAILRGDGRFALGTDSPAASSLLQLDSTTKGFLGPRMTAAQRDLISSPTPGLLIFNTDTGKLNVRGASGWEAVTSA